MFFREALICGVGTLCLVISDSNAALADDLIDAPRELAQFGGSVRVYEKKSKKTPTPVSATTRNRPAAKQTPAAVSIVIGDDDSSNAPETPQQSAASAAKYQKLRDKLDQVQAQAEQAADESSGTEAASARMRALCIAALKEDTIQFAEASDSLITLDSIDPVKLTSPAIIDQRIAQFQLLRKRNSAMLASLRTVPPTWTNALQEMGFSEEPVELAVDAGRKVMQLDEKQHYHDSCDKLCESATRMLRILKQNWGKWKAVPNTRIDTICARLPAHDGKALMDAVTIFIQQFGEMKAAGPNAGSSG